MFYNLSTYLFYFKELNLLMHNSEQLYNLPSNLNKKSYSPLKVSRLGSLTQLTHGSIGPKSDAKGTQMA